MPTVRISADALLKLHDLARLERRTQIAVLDGLLGVTPSTPPTPSRNRPAPHIPTAPPQYTPSHDLTYEPDES